MGTVKFALDGLKKGQPVRVRRERLLLLLSICASEKKLLDGEGKSIIDAVMGLHLDDLSSNLAAAALFYRLTSDDFLDKMKSSDPDSSSIFLKVEEILTQCEVLKSSGGVGDVTGRPELSPKWIALLTMEKASATMAPLQDLMFAPEERKACFKEKFRELGGLDAVFDILQKCQTILEARLEPRSHANQYPMEDVKAENLLLLLKSLKIMENATFLSRNNQSHFLGMNVNLNHRKPSSSTEVIISVIKSGVFLHKRYGVSSEEMPCNFSDGAGDTCDVAVAVGITAAVGDETSSKCFRRESSFSLGKSFSLCQNSPFSTTQFASTSEASASSLADTSLLKMRVDSSTYCSLSVASRSSNSERFHVNDDLKRSSILGKRKQESSSGKKLMICQESTGEKYFSHERINLDASHELLADCLLTAVKVLRNLTYENLVGCQKIAACGGLEVMSSLMACHFPLFSSSSSSCTETQDNNLSQSTIEIDPFKRQIKEQQLDFLVAILGLLVNLLEDSHNRSRLASFTNLLPSGEGVDGENCRYVIPLLCSIFLASRGKDEAADEGLPGCDRASFLMAKKKGEQGIVKANSALLLALLSTERESISSAIVDLLREHNMATLVSELERYLEFHMEFSLISPETHLVVNKAIASWRPRRWHQEHGG